MYPSGKERNGLHMNMHHLYRLSAYRKTKSFISLYEVQITEKYKSNTILKPDQQQ
jgi:hypothetical protein